MSLLNETYEKCVLLEKKRVPDGEGGFVTEWAEGAEFDAAITLDGSTETRIAMAQGVKALYTVTTYKALTLEYHDVIKRLSDGKIFRITSDGDDRKTPERATFQIRQVNAEEWQIT